MKLIKSVIHAKIKQKSIQIMQIASICSKVSVFRILFFLMGKWGVERGGRSLRRPRWFLIDPASKIQKPKSPIIYT